MIKLLQFLFEGVASETIVRELAKAFDSPYNTTVMAIGHQFSSEREAAEQFYKLNKKTFDRILNGASKCKFLGAGSYGIAFDLGNQVLKIEKRGASDNFDSEKRTKESEKQLWGKTEAGRAVPMIYDKGIMTLGTGWEFAWTILEKFEPMNENDALFDEILDQIMFGVFVSQEDQQIIANKYRLADDWLERFKTDIHNLRRSGVYLDLHSGNIGIRRHGGVGYLVVFD